MDEPYIGKDATNTFNEYRLFWKGSTADITFTVGHECKYGVDCAEQGKEGEPGTCMTKQMIISVDAPSTALDQISSKRSTLNAKRIANGQLLIQRGDELFNAQGTRVE